MSGEAYALDVHCPTCDAVVTDPCVTRGGNLAAKPHAARVTAGEVAYRDRIAAARESERIARQVAAVPAGGVTMASTLEPSDVPGSRELIGGGKRRVTVEPTVDDARVARNEASRAAGRTNPDVDVPIGAGDLMQAPRNYYPSDANHKYAGLGEETVVAGIAYLRECDPLIAADIWSRSLAARVDDASMVAVGAASYYAKAIADGVAGEATELPGGDYVTRTVAHAVNRAASRVRTAERRERTVLRLFAEPTDCVSLADLSDARGLFGVDPQRQYDMNEADVHAAAREYLAGSNVIDATDRLVASRIDPKTGADRGGRVPVKLVAEWTAARAVVVSQDVSSQNMSPVAPHCVQHASSTTARSLIDADRAREVFPVTVRYAN